MNVSKYFVFLIFEFLFVAHFEINVKANTIQLKAKNILNELLNLSRYDPTVVPVGWNETSNEELPVIVYVNLLVRSIDEFDDAKERFSPQITFRQQWNDPQLKFDDQNGQISYLSLMELKRIWTPDNFIKNEFQGHYHHLLKPNHLVRIYPNGDVRYSVRVTLNLTCPMNHKYYPHSKQICQVSLASYGSTTRDYYHVWRRQDAVQIANRLNIKGYSLTQYLTDYCTSRTATGDYSCIVLEFLFESNSGRFVRQLYLPSTALLIVSWLSFWLHPKATAARATLLILATISMFFLLTSFELPPVDYTMLIHYWVGACYVFLFGAMIEFALVSSLVQVEQSDSENVWNCARKIDLISRAIFPLSFVLFCIFYRWKIYCSKEFTFP